MSPFAALRVRVAVPICHLFLSLTYKQREWDFSPKRFYRRLIPDSTMYRGNDHYSSHFARHDDVYATRYPSPGAPRARPGLADDLYGSAYDRATPRLGSPYRDDDRLVGAASAALTPRTSSGGWRSVVREERSPDTSGYRGVGPLGLTASRETAAREAAFGVRRSLATELADAEYEYRPTERATYLHPSTVAPRPSPVAAWNEVDEVRYGPRPGGPAGGDYGGATPRGRSPATGAWAAPGGSYVHGGSPARQRTATPPGGTRWVAAGEFRTDAQRRADSPGATARGGAVPGHFSHHPAPRDDTPPRPASAAYGAARFARASPAMALSSAVRRTPSMQKDPLSTFLPPSSDPSRPTVVLDLDETLVYARDGPVKQRPFLGELLNGLAQGGFEVVVWTAGERDYAQGVIRSIDPNGVIEHCVYRHHKWWTGRPGYSKNLLALGRRLDRTLLVDNTPDCLRDHPSNGLLVADFEGRAGAGTDDTLRVLLHLMLDFRDQPGVAIAEFLQGHQDIVPRDVPCDHGGSSVLFTLRKDAHLGKAAYHHGRTNRDAPSAARAWRGY